MPAGASRPTIFCCRIPMIPLTRRGGKVCCRGKASHLGRGQALSCLERLDEQYTDVRLPMQRVTALKL
jgi:hypothetical protein